MAVTRSTIESRTAPRPGVGNVPAVAGAPAGRAPELVWLLAAIMIVCGAWWSVYTAKSRRALGTGAVAPLNISRVESAEALYPVLSVFPDATEKAAIAKKMLDIISDHDGALPNTGILARAKLFTPAQFAQIKPQIAVRTLADFRHDFLLWTGVILAAFLITHIVWAVRRFTGPWAFLPLLLIVTGIGLALMVALRDPLRDTQIFVPYAQGVAGGCLVMLFATFIDWESSTVNFSFVPLLGAIGLSAALIFAGTGPGGSDARVNLGRFSPSKPSKSSWSFSSPATSPGNGRCCVKCARSASSSPSWNCRLCSM